MAKSIKFEVQIKDAASGALRTVAVQARSADDALRKLSGQAARAGSQLQRSFNLSAVSALATGAIGALQSSVDSMVQPYRAFEDSMATVNTMAGKNADELGALTDQVKELSKNVPIAREQLADGLYQVISNGVPQSSWIGYLTQSARAAAGGCADLGKTVTVTSTLIKNYGADWTEAGHIQDIIQTTAKNGVTSFEQLADALPRVSTNAAKLGVGMDELMAVFATTTGVTGNTAEVSTQLAAVLNSLVKPSSEAQKAAAAMGIQFDAAAIKAAGGFRNFITQLDDSVKAYATQTGELSETIYGKLFGSAEALRLIGSVTGEQRDTLAANIEAMKGSAGTIDAAFEQVASTASAQAQMTANARLSLTDWAASVASACKPALDFAASLGMGVTGAVQVTSSLGGVVGALTSFVRSGQLAATVTKAFSAVQAALNLILSANPISIIVLALAGLAAALRIAYVHSKTFRDLVDRLWAALKQTAVVVVDVAKKVWQYLVAAFEACAKVVRTVWEYIKKLFGITDSGPSTAPVVARTEAVEELGETANESAQEVKNLLEQLNKANGANMPNGANEINKANPAVPAAAAAAPLPESAFDFQNISQYQQRLEELRQAQQTASAKRYAELQRQIDKTESLLETFKRLRATIDDTSDVSGRLGKVLPAALDKPLTIIPTLQKGVTGLNTATARMGEQRTLSEVLGKGLEGVAGMLRNTGSILGENARAWLNYASSVLQAVSAAIPAIVALACTEAAESGMKLPFPVNLIAAGAAIASVLAAMASIPKFAQGGIAYGPTLGLFGEYAGASRNPEVVAPLDRLQQLIQPAGTQAALPPVIRLYARGEDLQAIINTRTKRISRT